MSTLDQLALNIELIVISLIESLALATLASTAATLSYSWANLFYIPFVLAGLATLMVFWSQAILHAVSFIRWPLRMEHMLLYFVAAFLQVIAYTSIRSPLNWFFWWTMFTFLVIVLYYVDLRILKDMQRQRVARGEQELAYLKKIRDRHEYEIRHLVPMSAAFNIIALVLVFWFRSSTHIGQIAFVLGMVEALVTLGALVDCWINFKKRSELISKLFHEV